MTREEPAPDAVAWRLLEERRPFARSQLWELQRRYYIERGVDAWAHGEVPSQITCNRRLADVYAEILTALRRDQERLGTPRGNPLHICELGGGSGRFAHFLLRRLIEICQRDGISTGSFRYLLTDLAPRNVEDWRRQSRFQDLFASGLLDVAVFDIERSDRLALLVSGETIAGGLEMPLVVVANYVFDSVPQDLLRLDHGTCHQVLLSLQTALHKEAETAAAALAGLQYRYDIEPLPGPPWADGEPARLLAEYRENVQGCIFMPVVALECLDRLAALSRRGLVLVTADRGDDRLAQVVFPSPPPLTAHASFSYDVNFHALTRWCERQGGAVLAPEVRYRTLDFLCLLRVADADSHTETRRAYLRHAADLGPAESFFISCQARDQAAAMTAEGLLSFLRWSRHDPELLVGFLPRLLELAATFPAELRPALRQTLDRAWDGYLPLGSQPDLAFGIAAVLYDLDDADGALLYFARSLELYGPHSGTLYNMALCHLRHGRTTEARRWLEELLDHDPAHEAAKARLAELATGGT